MEQIIQLCDDLGVTHGASSRDGATSGHLKALFGAVRSRPAAQPIELTLDHMHLLPPDYRKPKGEPDRFTKLQKLFIEVWIYEQKIAPAVRSKISNQQATHAVKEGQKSITDKAATLQNSNLARSRQKPATNRASTQRDVNFAKDIKSLTSQPKIEQGPLTRLKNHDQALIACLSSANIGPDLPLVFDSVDDMIRYLKRCAREYSQPRPIGCRAEPIKENIERLSFVSPTTYLAGMYDHVEVIKFKIKYEDIDDEEDCRGYALLENSGVCMYVVPSVGCSAKSRGYHGFLGENKGFTEKPIAVSQWAPDTLRLPEDVKVKIEEIRKKERPSKGTDDSVWDIESSSESSHAIQPKSNKRKHPPSSSSQAGPAPKKVQYKFAKTKIPALLNCIATPKTPIAASHNLPSRQQKDLSASSNSTGQGHAAILPSQQIPAPEMVHVSDEEWLDTEWTSSGRKQKVQRRYNKKRTVSESLQKDHLVAVPIHKTSLNPAKAVYALSPPTSDTTVTDKKRSLDQFRDDLAEKICLSMGDKVTLYFYYPKGGMGPIPVSLRECATTEAFWTRTKRALEALGYSFDEKNMAGVSVTNIGLDTAIHLPWGNVGWQSVVDWLYHYSKKGTEIVDVKIIGRTAAG